MTRDEFLDAADRRRPVRLKDRSLCFYDDEWYRPYTAPDGRLAVAAHTGEQHDVDDAVLKNLTDEIPPLTVAALLRAAPRGGEARTVVVIADSDDTLQTLGAYDAESASITSTNGDLRKAEPRESGRPAVLLRAGTPPLADI